MKDLEDLFLNEHRKHTGIRQELGDELLDAWQKDLHSGQEWIPLLSLLEPKHNHHSISTANISCLSSHQQ